MVKLSTEGFRRLVIAALKQEKNETAKAHAEAQRQRSRYSGGADADPEQEAFHGGRAAMASESIARLSRLIEDLGGNSD